jgi:hypothetical protein
MGSKSAGFLGAVLVGMLLTAPKVCAQGVELTPFGGYRAGTEFFDILAGRSVNFDGAPAFGLVLDYPLWEGAQVEGFFSRQTADAAGVPGPVGPPPVWRISVDQWQVGGLQEFAFGNARPFLTGTLGLTRYANAADSEIRFALSAGGGVKFFASPHFGLRLDGRVFATFVDANTNTIACGPGACFLGLHVNVDWQAEFTVGLIVKLPH